MYKNSTFVCMLIALSCAFIPGCKKKSAAHSQKDTNSAAQQEKKKRKYFRDLTYDELRLNKERLVREGRKETAINHLEKMLPLCNNIQELRDMTLEIADLLFDIGNLKKAEKLYNQFVQLYPGDKHIEYASYRAILCCFWQTLDAERDQTKTNDTIAMAKAFLGRSEVFKEYTNEVSDILVQCKNRIFESEEKVFRFYLHRGDLLSAKHRLENMEKTFKGTLPDAEPKLILMACDFAAKLNDEAMLAEKQTEMQTKFPDYQSELVVAQKQETKKPAADRF